MAANWTGATRAIDLEQQLVYPPADVARRLGISGAGLRRLAQGYERVFRPLPRDPKHGRLWPEAAVRHMEAARAMVGAGKASSVEEALDTLARRDLSENGHGLRNSYDDNYKDSMDVLVQVLRALRLTLENQQQSLTSLEAEVRVLRTQLPGSWPADHALPWWRRWRRLLPRL